MSLINKEGKLFGIINIIDLAVVALIAVVLIGGAFRFKKAAPQIVSESQKSMVKLEVSEVRQPTVDGIEVGDELYHYDRGQYFGKIVKKEVENYKEAVPTSEGNLVLSDVPEKFNVVLYVEADAVNSSDTISIGGEQIRIGNQYRMKNKDISVFATVFKVDLEK